MAKREEEVNGMTKEIDNSSMSEPGPLKSTGRIALKFVLLFGVVSLFADMTYEGARSINGSFLGILGASATIVGIVAGFGELVGYGLRFVSGKIGDRTGLYWPITFLGYIINLLAVPLLALVGNWPVAAALIIAERTGRAIRVPTRDAMLAHAASQVGQGWGFGVHNALDQIGATVGPLIVAAVLLFAKGDYRPGFAILLVPALLALGTLTAARITFPRPQDLEKTNPTPLPQGLRRPFWLYLVAAALLAAGYVDYPLFAFHFQKTALIDNAWIPLYFAVAMAVAAITGLVCGRLYDRYGFKVLIVVALIVAFATPLVLLGNAALALLGVAIWGIGMGVQDSTFRGVLADMVSSQQRATAYGIFDTAYGVCWFLGSSLMGFLYDVSFPALIIFSVVIQLAALPLLLLVRKASA